MGVPWRSSGLRPLRAGLVLLAACSGSLGPAGSPDAGDGGGGGAEPDGSADCAALVCPAGQECVRGRCQAVDPCREVRCDNPGELCSGGVCVPGAADRDGDGFPAAEDCDDGEAEVHPGAPETCNGRDDDCDGEVDEGFDRDGDGFTSCGDGTPASADCDDGDPAVHPGAAERCNGRDDDCDGAVDEDVAGLGAACGTTTGDCSAGVTACVGGELVCLGAVGPRAERCDGTDRDCDGLRLCADPDCDGVACDTEARCFGGFCATPCSTHNDGSVSCGTLCGWCRGTCVGAVTDAGSVVSCGVSGEPAWCYCRF